MYEEFKCPSASSGGGTLFLVFLVLLSFGLTYFFPEVEVAHNAVCVVLLSFRYFLILFLLRFPRSCTCMHEKEHSVHPIKGPS